MYSYTNRRGETVYVNDDHIVTAIRIKIELQKASPSNKCSWNVHKQLMEQEGFNDSENSEAYRLFIKRQQHNRGLLPSSQKYMDLVADKKLESLKEMVGDMYVERRALQNVNRELNKTKRQIADEFLVIDELKDLLKVEITTTQQKLVYNNPSNHRVAVITPSDWHIGLLTNGLTFKDARKRIDDYIAKVKYYCEMYEIDTIFVANLGDIINHVYMHKNTQAYSSEFTVAEQINNAVRVMYDLLVALSMDFKVNYLGTISGNHGRMSVKGETLTGDSVEAVVDGLIRTLIDVSKDKTVNLSYINEGYTTEYIDYQIFGKNFVFVHGDKETRDGSAIIKKYSSMLSKPIDVLVKGHTHTFKVETENHGRKIITSGCLMGSDDYAEGLGYITEGSQLMIVVDEHLGVTPIEIVLK